MLLTGHDKGVSGVKFSPDGSKLITGRLILVTVLFNTEILIIIAVIVIV